MACLTPQVGCGHDATRMNSRSIRSRVSLRRRGSRCVYPCPTCVSLIPLLTLFHPGRDGLPGQPAIEAAPQAAGVVPDCKGVQVPEVTAASPGRMWGASGKRPRGLRESNSPIQITHRLRPVRGVSSAAVLVPDSGVLGRCVCAHGHIYRYGNLRASTRRLSGYLFTQRACRFGTGRTR